MSDQHYDELQERECNRVTVADIVAYIETNMREWKGEDGMVIALTIRDKLLTIGSVKA